MNSKPHPTPTYTVMRQRHEQENNEKKKTADGGGGAGGSSNGHQKQKSVHEAVHIKGLKHSLNMIMPDEQPSLNREEYVDYALDMLVHNLIGAGQLDASKAHLLKTSDVREHVRNLAEKAAQAKQAGVKTQMSSSMPSKGTRWALQPNSVPITIVTNKDPSGKSKSTDNKKSHHHHHRSNTLRVPNTTTTTNKTHPNATSTNPDRWKSTPNGFISFRRSKPTMDPWEIKNVDYSNTSLKKDSSLIINQQQASKASMSRVLHSRSRTLMANSTPLKSVKSDEKILEEEPVAIPGTSRGSPANKPSDISKLVKHMSRYYQSAVIGGDKSFKVKLDMRGFNNEEISLDLDGRKLTITGIRPKRDGLNPRRASETVDIPGHINIDNLKIARRVDGMLIIQEGDIQLK